MRNRVKLDGELVLHGINGTDEDLVSITLGGTFSFKWDFMLPLHLLIKEGGKYYLPVKPSSGHPERLGKVEVPEWTASLAFWPEKSRYYFVSKMFDSMWDIVPVGGYLIRPLPEGYMPSSDLPRMPDPMPVPVPQVE